MVGCTVLRVGFGMGEFRLFWLWCLFFHLCLGGLDGGGFWGCKWVNFYSCIDWYIGGKCNLFIVYLLYSLG